MPAGPSTRLRADTPTLERPQTPRGPAGHGGDGFSDRSGGDGGASAQPVSPAKIGVWLLVGAITILFAAFTSSYLVRRGQADWQVGPLAPVLWVNTAILLLSSIAMERARVLGRRGYLNGLRVSLAIVTALGIAFLAGQVLAWRQLVAAGIYLASNPHSSFFYMLTGAHGVHLVGGIGALFYASWKVRWAFEPTQAMAIVDPTATYWHFIGGLWLYVFLILFAL